MIKKTAAFLPFHVYLQVLLFQVNSFQVFQLFLLVFVPTLSNNTWWYLQHLDLFFFSYYRHPDFVEWRIRTYLLHLTYICMCTHTLLHPSSQYIKHFLTKSFIYCLHFYNYENILHSQVIQFMMGIFSCLTTFVLPRVTNYMILFICLLFNDLVSQTWTEL